MKINLDLAKNLSLTILISALFLYLGQNFGFLAPIIGRQSLKTIILVSLVILAGLFWGNLIAWLENKIPTRRKHFFTKPRVFPLPLIVCLETIIFYLAFIIPAEYLLTEKYSFLKFIHPQQKTTLFLIIFTIVFLANYCQPQIRKIGQRLGLVLMVFLIIALLADQAYTEFYQRLQENPKIYSLSSDWSIVGMEIEIDGKNFGPAWQAGKVTVDDFQMQVKDWAEEKIIILQPHLPRFFTGELCVEKYNGRVSNCFPFTIRNPGELHQE